MRSRTTDVPVCVPARYGSTDEAAVRRLAQRLALAAGRRMDDASPYVDGWLASASRRRNRVPLLASTLLFTALASG